MCRVANGAKSTGAVSPRVRTGCPAAARETDRGRQGVPADSLLTPERAALRRDEDGVDLIRFDAAIDVGHGGLEGARRHLLVALVEQLTELDEPGPGHGDAIPTHQCAPATPRSTSRPRPYPRRLAP